MTKAFFINKKLVKRALAFQFIIIASLIIYGVYLYYNELLSQRDFIVISISSFTLPIFQMKRLWRFYSFGLKERPLILVEEGQIRNNLAKNFNSIQFKDIESIQFINNLRGLFLRLQFKKTLENNCIGASNFLGGLLLVTEKQRTWDWRIGNITPDYTELEAAINAKILEIQHVDSNVKLQVQP